MGSSRTEHVTSLMRRHDFLKNRIDEYRDRGAPCPTYDISEKKALEWALLQLVDMAIDLAEDDPDWVERIHELVPVEKFLEKVTERNRKKDKNRVNYFCETCRKLRKVNVNRLEEVQKLGMCFRCHEGNGLVEVLKNVTFDAENIKNLAKDG